MIHECYSRYGETWQLFATANLRSADDADGRRWGISIHFSSAEIYIANRHNLRMKTRNSNNHESHELHECCSRFHADSWYSFNSWFKRWFRPAAGLRKSASICGHRLLDSKRWRKRPTADVSPAGDGQMFGPTATGRAYDEPCCDLPPS